MIVKITTDAHGSFPSEKSLKSNGLRIAFVNSDDVATYLRASKGSKDVLILAADDISEDATPAWMQSLLKLPATLSDVSKRHLWRSTYTKGFPSAPLCLGDGQAILDFHSELEGGRRRSPDDQLRVWKEPISDHRKFPAGTLPAYLWKNTPSLPQQMDERHA